MQQAVFGIGPEENTERRWQPPSLESIQVAFPQLEIIELIGSGGMGAVYKAKQKSLGRLIALKVLAPHYAENPDFAERFAREAKVLAEVTHPHIVAVHDFGFASPFYYLWMEFVDGVNLRQAMIAAKLTPEQALKIVPPICEALQFAHQRGIVHRDIKPENLLLDKFGTIKLVDFGIARLLKTPAAMAGAESYSGSSDSDLVNAQSNDPQLTGTSVIGTPNYMAPEQRTEPQNVDHRADIYSLGVVLYEMLTGELPGLRWTPPSQKVQIDVRLDEVVLRALNVKPEQRYSTASEFQQSIESVSTTVSHLHRQPLSESQVPIRFSKCLLTNRNELQSAFEQFFLWRKNGHVQLTDSQIQLTRDTAITTIALESVESVSLGLLPAVVNPYGLNFVEIEYQVRDQKESVIFIPNERIFDFPSLFNLRTYQWWELIRQRVEARTGKAPGIRHAKDLLSRSVRYSSWMILSLVALALASLFLLTQVMVRQASGGGSIHWWAWIGAALFASVVLTPTLIMAAFRSRNNPDNPRFHLRMAWLKSQGRPSAMSKYLIIVLIAFPFIVGGLAGIVIPWLSMRTVLPPTGAVPSLVSPIPPAESVFPNAVHIGGSRTLGKPSLYYSISRGKFDFVIFYIGEFGSSAGGAQNPINGTWSQDIRITLENERTFHVLRSFLDENTITINGSDKHFNGGRLIQLMDDGTCKQFSSAPPETALGPSSIYTWIEIALASNSNTQKVDGL